jgi:hypothetical protein
MPHVLFVALNQWLKLLLAIRIDHLDIIELHRRVTGASAGLLQGTSIPPAVGSPNDDRVSVREPNCEERKKRLVSFFLFQRSLLPHGLTLCEEAVKQGLREAMLHLAEVVFRSAQVPLTQHLVPPDTSATQFGNVAKVSSTGASLMARSVRILKACHQISALGRQ